MAPFSRSILKNADGDDERCWVALNCEREPGRSLCVPSTLLLLSTQYQAHCYCSALSTKHTSIAQHSTQRTLRMLSIEHSMPLQRCLLSFAQAGYTQVCSIKDLESENRHSKSMFCRHTVLQPGPIVISAISSKCTSLCTLYNVL